jgi:hypothetical protein
MVVSGSRKDLPAIMHYVHAANCKLQIQTIRCVFDTELCCFCDTFLKLKVLHTFVSGTLEIVPPNS